MSDDQAYKAARRSIVNNALRRQQKSLDLRNKQLTSLPPEIGQLTELENLDLSGNQLSTLPPEIGQLTGLLNLDINGNQLSALPPEIGQLTGLRGLFLNGNQLSVLPPEIGQMTGLRSLDLSENQLSALPPEIGQMTGLQTLILNENQLSALPPEIGKMTALKILLLDKNQLSALPPEIGKMIELQGLDLRQNQLSAMPPEIGQITGLQRLDLRTNRLSALPAEFSQLHSLQVAAERDFDPLTEGLWLNENPLPNPYPKLILEGQPSATMNVLAWLRGELDPTTLAQPGPNSTSAPELPAQGYGPHFEIDADGIITFAAPATLDRDGNNLARLSKLHPTLRLLAEALVEALGTGNVPYGHLHERAKGYRACIDESIEKIDFALLYVEGVRLANAARAALLDNELPPSWTICPRSD